jgi:protein arginine kinase activator
MESTPILCCSKCLTTLESLQTGGDLGCDQCYAVFDQALIEKLVQEKKIPPINGEEFSRDSIHQGKSPHRSHAISPIHQMAVLDEALHEALQKEQYEQAAWLRDQIKTWKEKISESA